MIGMDSEIPVTSSRSSLGVPVFHKQDRVGCMCGEEFDGVVGRPEDVYLERRAKHAAVHIACRRGVALQYSMPRHLIPEVHFSDVAHAQAGLKSE